MRPEMGMEISAILCVLLKNLGFISASNDTFFVNDLPP